MIYALATVKKSSKSTRGGAPKAPKKSMPKLKSDVRILVADDEQALNELYTARLRMEGYNVDNAYDGEETLKKIQSGNPDLLMLDLMMPRVTGMEVLKVLKSSSATRDLPIIILTALSTRRTVGEEYNTSGILIKGESTLQDVIDEVNRVVREFVR